MEVQIRYCVPCGYLPTALDMAKQLLGRFRHDLAALKLVPGEDGVFDVSVDGELVFSKNEAGRFPKEEEIAKEIKGRLT